jgi:hypothetical protein
MMSTVNAAPPPSEVRRMVAIDFLFLDLSTCGRCLGSGANIETALDALEGVLRATGARVELRRVHVRSVERARRLGISVSGAKARVQRGRLQLRALLLECCHVELDRRGGITEYRARTGSCERCRTTI